MIVKFEFVILTTGWEKASATDKKFSPIVQLPKTKDLKNIQ